MRARVATGFAVLLLVVTILSAGAGGEPPGWGGLSGLAAHPTEPGRLYGVSDNAYPEGYILTIDATKTPAVVTATATVTRDGKPAANLDLEGITVAADGGFWLASEGNPERKKHPTFSTLYKTDAGGAITATIALPETLAAVSTRYGFEGVAAVGAGADETVWLAVQREWRDDPKGFVRLLAYRPATGSWGQVRYPLEISAGKGKVGLSELTAVPGGLIAVERDNRSGKGARVKLLTRIDLTGVTPAPLDAADVPVVRKTIVRDLLQDGHELDKIEGFAVDAAGNAFAVADRDGAAAETRIVPLGRLAP